MFSGALWLLSILFNPNHQLNSMPLTVQSESISSPLRDTVEAVPTTESKPPAIVSISDIHGYLTEARDALLTLQDHPEYEPIVSVDDDGRLHWADENYVLVFNGDLVDRGPDNKRVLEMVARLIDEAPAGRVRVTLGNHEWMIMMPNKYQHVDWYSTETTNGERREYLQRIADGHVVAAYDGYTVTYAHAGARESYDIPTVNDSLIDAAAELESAIGTPDDPAIQSTLPEEYPTVLGTGDRAVKGPDAGLAWIHFKHLPADAPPQVVGHTRHRKPQTTGNVYCQDVLQDNLESTGGQGVFIETPDSLTALLRDAEQGVSTHSLS